jgi:hypothetical protein
MGATFLSAVLAGYGAFVLAEHLPWHLGGFAALYGFLATGALGLRAVDGIKDDRVRRSVERWESYQRQRDKNSN